jgi:hypothetical protein
METPDQADTHIDQFDSRTATPRHDDDRFVAHFDMLGISTLTKRDPDFAWACLGRLNQARLERLHLPIERIDTGEVIRDRIHALIFSDTVIAFSKSNTPNDALALVILTTELFALSLHYCLPLRGGIAHGRFMFNLQDNLFCGPALADAYALGERSQWIGIVTDDRVADTLHTIPFRTATGLNGIVPWDLEVKDLGRARRMVVNWPQTHRESYMGSIPLTAQEFYAPLARGFGQWSGLPLAVRRKYENTVAFLNAQINVAGSIDQSRT